MGTGVVLSYHAMTPIPVVPLIPSVCPSTSLLHTDSGLLSAGLPVDLVSRYVNFIPTGTRGGDGSLLGPL